MLRLVVLCIIFTIANALIKGKDQAEQTCVLLLDGSTFSKVVPHHNLSTVLMIASRADEGDYGIISIKEDFWAFAEQSELVGQTDSVRFAQMLVDKKPVDGSTAAETFNQAMKLDKKFFEKMNPRIYLFRPGSVRPEMYPQFARINAISLSRWLSQKVNFYVGIDGTIHKFYRLARNFMAADTAIARTDIMGSAKSAVDAISGTVPEEVFEMAGYYLKTMERIVERGDEFVPAEISRLEELVSGDDVKLSQEKRQALQKRVNVLHNFLVSPPVYVSHDEL